MFCITKAKQIGLKAIVVIRLMLVLLACKILFTSLRRVSRHKYALRDSERSFCTTKAFLFRFQFTIVLNIHDRGTLETMHCSSYYAKTSNAGIYPHPKKCRNSFNK